MIKNALGIDIQDSVEVLKSKLTVILNWNHMTPSKHTILKTYFDNVQNHAVTISLLYNNSQHWQKEMDWLVKHTTEFTRSKKVLQNALKRDPIGDAIVSRWLKLNDRLYESRLKNCITTPKTAKYKKLKSIFADHDNAPPDFNEEENKNAAFLKWCVKQRLVQRICALTKKTMSDILEGKHWETTHIIDIDKLPEVLQVPDLVHSRQLTSRKGVKVVKLTPKQEVKIACKLYKRCSMLQNIKNDTEWFQQYIIMIRKECEDRTKVLDAKRQHNQDKKVIQSSEIVESAGNGVCSVVGCQNKHIQK